MSLYFLQQFYRLISIVHFYICFSHQNRRPYYYFLQNIYTGKRKKAKKTYIKLDHAEKKRIKKEHKRLHKEYLANLEEFCATITSKKVNFKSHLIVSNSYVPNYYLPIFRRWKVLRKECAKPRKSKERLAIQMNRSSNFFFVLSFFIIYCNIVLKSLWLFTSNKKKINKMLS